MVSGGCQGFRGSGGCQGTRGPGGLQEGRGPGGGQEVGAWRWSGGQVLRKLLGGQGPGGRQGPVIQEVVMRPGAVIVVES